MKYLSDYTSPLQTELFNKCNAFFAFNLKQFDAGKKPGIKYNRLPGGLICDVTKIPELLEGLDTIQAEGIKQDIKDHGIKKIILRELNNYECYYTGDPSDAIENLAQYGITSEQVYKLFRNKKAEI